MQTEATCSFLNCRPILGLGLWALLLGIGLASSALGTSSEASTMAAMVKTGPEGVEWFPERGESRFTLTVSGPDGVFQREFPAGKNPRLAVRDKKHGTLADGHYRWELRAAPKLDGISSRQPMGNGAVDENGRPVKGTRKPVPGKGTLPESGSFSVVKGLIVDLGSREPVPELEQTGSLEVAGDLLVEGKKSFKVTDTDGASAIVYVALEGPEAGTYFRGTARTVHGKAEIELPPHFSKVTEGEGLTAQLTPLGAWSRLYVEAITPERLVVRDAENGDDVEFDFLIQGVRKGHAGHIVERPATSNQ